MRRSLYEIRIPVRVAISSSAALVCTAGIGLQGQDYSGWSCRRLAISISKVLTNMIRSFWGRSFIAFNLSCSTGCSVACWLNIYVFLMCPGETMVGAAMVLYSSPAPVACTLLYRIISMNADDTRNTLCKSYRILTRWPVTTFWRITWAD